MRHPNGGFYSSEDADSEGQEGLFYTWTPDELVAVLGRERADTFAKAYGVTQQGNFEGRSIVHLPRSLAATQEPITGRSTIGQAVAQMARRNEPASSLPEGPL